MIVGILFYFTPLASIILLGFYMILLLRNIRRKKNIILRGANLTRHNTLGSIYLSTNTSTNFRFLREPRPKFANFVQMFRLGPQVKFQIIIISYWIQWLPSFTINLFNPFCQCIPVDISEGIYWLTFSVSMTDPLVVLLLNPNVALKKQPNPRIGPI